MLTDVETVIPADDDTEVGDNLVLFTDTLLEGSRVTLVLPTAAVASIEEKSI